MQESFAKNRIDALLNANHLPHAIIIEGDGDKKLSLAKYLAKAFLCEEKATGCNSCKSCHLVDVGTHPDILTIAPSSPKSKIHAVEKFQELSNEIMLAPFMSNGRVVHITAGEILNDRCQNTMLKILEEPPNNLLFIITTTNTSNLLDTIKSRAVTFNIDGSENEEHAELKEIAKKIFNKAEQGKRYEILVELNKISDRAELDLLVLFIKQMAVDKLKGKQMGEASSFSDKRLNNIVINLSELKRKMDLNPNKKLLYAVICDYLTANY